MVNIFVFGSNEAGRHGKGAAKTAFLRHGAVYGKGVGLYGKSYAIPTKDVNLVPLPLNKIQKYVEQFLRFADLNKDRYEFTVTEIGCGLAGYHPTQIAPMFKGAPSNCILPVGWRVIAETSLPESILWQKL